MFEKGLYALLANDATLSPVVGESIYFAQLPKGSPFPALVLATISNVPIVTLSDTADLQTRRVQIDCISSIDQIDARTLSNLVSELLEDYTGVLPDGTMVSTVIQENDLDMPFEVGALGYAYRVALDFTFWITEPNS